jgi:CubicO group peptidase (beta-lactamase class C family)
MKTRSIFTLITITLIVLAGCTTTRPTNSAWVAYSYPHEVGVVSDSLNKIDAFINEMISAGKIPGAAVLVAREGKIVYHKAFGLQDIEQSLPLDTNDIFRIASMTKPIVSVAIMQLYEHGLLRLDDPVSKYIPSFANPQVLENVNMDDTTWSARPAEREVTIHHLLNHTSGIGYSFASRQLAPIYAKSGIPDLANPRDLTIEDVADRLGSLPLMFDPGSKYTYGLSIDVLGRVVEVVSGMTLGEYIQKQIAEPLRMTDTKFFFTEDVAGRLTTAYMYNPRERKLTTTKTEGAQSTSDYPVYGAKKYFSGGSGLSSTPRDYFIFSQTILNGGIYNGVRILKEETVALMTSDKLDSLRWSDISTFGYGFSIDRKRDSDGSPGPVTGLGWAGAFNTWFTINPNDNIVAIIMSQVLFNPYEQELVSNFRRSINSSIVR